MQRGGTCEPSLQRPDEFPPDGVEISLSAVRKRYTKAQLETAAYAEALHAELSSTLTRKHISIALHKALY